jgi:hypothetical protein
MKGLIQKRIACCCISALNNIVSSEGRYFQYGGCVAGRGLVGKEEALMRIIRQA